MKENNKKYSRRTFLKTAGAAGLGSLAASLSSSAEASTGLIAANQEPIIVPKRPFGKTGENVAVLSLGGMFDIPNNQLLLKQAVKWGVTYWDTANSYGGGRSEKGIGKYLSRYPEDRKKIFLVTKSGAWTTGGMTSHLEKSLRRMRTDYIDLFFVHGISSIDEMDDDVRAWGEKAKSRGQIRFFGFSTHSNMASCLIEAPALGWIDGIMMTYNYRLMHDDSMRAAVDACSEAGIGLTAMKTQGGRQVRTDTETELQLAGRFVKKGFTPGQAKMKAVWENSQIASICSQMPNMSLLMTNTAAAVNKTRLGAADKKLLRRYAHETVSDYCAGCTEICEPVMANRVPIGNIMRYLMYARSYGDLALAIEGFRSIPSSLRRQLARLDYTDAERRCPRNLAIGKLMREAVDELS